MKNFYLLSPSTPTKGFLWLFLLFFFCFLGVHFFRLAIIGVETLRKAERIEPDKAEEKKSPAQPAQEPVYYIVERKKGRKAPSYGEPKEIRFK